jgi:hypothetical protein
MTIEDFSQKTIIETISGRYGNEQLPVWNNQQLIEFQKNKNKNLNTLRPRTISDPFETDNTIDFDSNENKEDTSSQMVVYPYNKLMQALRRIEPIEIEDEFEYITPPRTLEELRQSKSILN